jgi:hypothetical protein
MGRRAITQIEIDEALVWNTNLLGNGLEVINGVSIETDRDLLLQLRGVWVLSGVGEIVFFAHRAPLRIELGFPGRSFPRRDDSDNTTFVSVAVTNNQEPQRRTQTKQNQAFLIFGMVGVVNQLGTLIEECGLRFLEAHTVLLKIGRGLSFVPVKGQCAHAKSVVTM